MMAVERELYPNNKLTKTKTSGNHTLRQRGDDKKEQFYQNYNKRDRYQRGGRGRDRGWGRAEAAEVIEIAIDRIKVETVMATTRQCWICKKSNHTAIRCKNKAERDRVCAEQGLCYFCLKNVRSSLERYNVIHHGLKKEQLPKDSMVYVRIGHKTEHKMTGYEVLLDTGSTICAAVVLHPRWCIVDHSWAELSRVDWVDQSWLELIRVD